MGNKRCAKKRPRVFQGTQIQLMAPVESPQVDTEAIPPSVSKQKLSGSSAGFISGRSTTVLLAYVTVELLWIDPCSQGNMVNTYFPLETPLYALFSSITGIISWNNLCCG